MINILKPGQIGSLLADNLVKYTLLKIVKNSFQTVPEGLIEERVNTMS